MDKTHYNIDLGLRDFVIGKRIYHYTKIKSTQQLAIPLLKPILIMNMGPSSWLMNKMKEWAGVKKNGLRP